MSGEITSEVESELGLPPERVKHDPMITAWLGGGCCLYRSAVPGVRVLLRVTREATEESGKAVSRVGHSLWKASEVDSDQTLHMYIVKHDSFGPAEVVVGVSITLHALLLALPRDLPSKTKSRLPRAPRSASQT